MKFVKQQNVHVYKFINKRFIRIQNDLTFYKVAGG